MHITMMLLKVILTLCMIGGLLITPLGLPGTIIIFIVALIYGIVTKFTDLSIAMLLILLILCVIAEGGDNALSVLFAKRSGASGKSASWSIIGAIIGGLIGAKLTALLLPITALGTPLIVLIPFVSAFAVLTFATGGSFVATLVYELRSGRDRKEALAIAKATAIGRVLGTMLKFFIALAMTIIVIVAMFGGT